MPLKADMAPSAPRAASSGPRARTMRLLLEEAHGLLRDGEMPSVAEVAARAGVSRATAYR